MDEINEKTAEAQTENSADKVKFYRLDKSKPYKAEGAASKLNFNFMIIVGALFLVAAVVVGVFTGKSISENLVMLVIPLFMGVFGGVFLAFGIKAQLNNNRKRTHEQSVLKDCVLTDGRITECSCIRHSHTDSDGDRHYTYDVTLTYTFFDESLNERTGGFHCVYSSDPQFYNGQYLMIAFNAYDSLIMREFALEGNDMNSFLENEAARSDDDFDGLTGEELDIDVNKPVRSFDGSIIWLIGGGSVLVFLVIYAVIVGGVMLPSIFGYDGIGLKDLGFLAGFAIMPCILIVIAVVLFVKYFKSVGPLKKIMKNNPYFTYGKMFASEKTYRGNSKKVVYCYIDKWGEKHTETAAAPLFQIETQGTEKTVVVAYDASGNSVVLTKYSLIER